jgi:hypothetical protein
MDVRRTRDIPTPLSGRVCRDDPIVVAAQPAVKISHYVSLRLTRHLDVLRLQRREAWQEPCGSRTAAEFWFIDPRERPTIEG